MEYNIEDCLGITGYEYGLITFIYSADFGVKSNIFSEEDKKQVTFHLAEILSTLETLGGIKEVKEDTEEYTYIYDQVVSINAYINKY